MFEFDEYTVYLSICFTSDYNDLPKILDGFNVEYDINGDTVIAFDECDKYEIERILDFHRIDYVSL